MLFIYMQIRQTRFRCDEITEDVLECKTRTQPVWLHPLKIQINIWLGTSTFVFTDFHCRRNCVCLFKSDPTLEFNPLQPNTVTAKDSSCCDPRVCVCVCVCDWPPWENHGMCLDPGKQSVSQSASQSPWCVYGTKSSVKVQSIRTVRLQAWVAAS